MRMWLIDPPSPFESLAKWEQFLEEMKELYEKSPDDEGVQSALKKAKQMVRKIKNHGPSRPY